MPTSSSPEPVTVDTVVVGASGAGLACARALADGGRRVLVLERKEEFTDPGRTWITTPRFTDIVGSVPEGVSVHRTGVMEMFAGPARASVPLDPADLIVERSRLLGHMADRARRAGATVRLASDVEDVRRPRDGFELVVKERSGPGRYRVRTRDLVGADGTHSTVAEIFGARPQKTVPIVQAKVELPAGYDSDVTRVWFDRAGTRFFYWLIPEGDRVGVAGLVPESPRTARQDLHRFVEEQDLQPLEYQGAVIPLHQPTRKIDWRFDTSRVLLVGDAAAHVKVTTVGGVVSGIWGARAAARALLLDTSYWKELRALHRELWIHDLIRWSIDRFDQEAYVRMLEMMNPRLRRLLSRRNRDSIAGATLELLKAQPRVLVLGLRSLLRPYRPETSERAEATPAWTSVPGSSGRSAPEVAGD